MASSRKSNLTDIVAARLAPLLPKRSHILIGLSGGMDSVVLLHLLHALTPRFEWRLSALHVHHGISSNADVWAEFCTELCRRHAIPLHIERVDIAPLRDAHGIEGAARQLRHAAFTKHCCDFIALAHHADDQAETMLLQLLRGAGLKGAAAMAVSKSAVPPVPGTLRPLLDVPRSTLLEFAQRHDLRWVEDESNADDNYPRNFLRHRLLPLLEERFPAYRDTLTRSAFHFAEASELLDELARQDAQGMTLDRPLDISCLRKLSRSRAKNLLRYFLQLCDAPMPQTVQLEEILRQLFEAREDASICVGFGDWQVRSYQNKVYVLRSLGEFDQSLVLPWHDEAELLWPALSEVITLRPCQGQGIDLAKLRQAQVTLRLRRGGESLRPHASAATRSLKNLLQEHRVPPWQRERLPLLYCGDDLVCVVGVATCAKYQAQKDQESVLVSCEYLDYDVRQN